MNRLFVVFVMGCVACGGATPRPGVRDCKDSCAHRADGCFARAKNSIEQSACDLQATKCMAECK